MKIRGAGDSLVHAADKQHVQERGDTLRCQGTPEGERPGKVRFIYSFFVSRLTKLPYLQLHVHLDRPPLDPLLQGCLSILQQKAQFALRRLHG